MIEGIDDNWDVQVMVEPQEEPSEQEKRKAVERIVNAVVAYIELTQPRPPTIIILKNRVTPPVSIPAPIETPMEVEEILPASTPASILRQEEIAKTIEKLQERIRYLKEQLAQEELKLKTRSQMEVLRQVRFAPADKALIENFIAEIKKEIRLAQEAVATLQDIK